MQIYLTTCETGNGHTDSRVKCRLAVRTALLIELKAQILVYISRNNDRYDIDWSSPDNISYQRIYEILSKIFEDITKEVSTIEYKKEDVYSIEFSLLYYEKDDNTIKYICSTPNISKEKLAEYLWVSLNVYRLKEEGVL